MDTNTLLIVQSVAIFLAMFWVFRSLEKKLDQGHEKLSRAIESLGSNVSRELDLLGSNVSRELHLLGNSVSGELDSRGNCVSREVAGLHQSSEAEHKEMIDKLSDIQRMQASNSERMTAVQTQVKSLDGKVDQLREGK